MKPLVHQSIKNFRVACGAEFGDVLTTSLCAHVTCPDCIAWREKLVDCVFEPLKEEPPAHADRLHSRA